VPGFWRAGFSKLSNRVLSDVIACGEGLWDIHTGSKSAQGTTFSSLFSAIYSVISHCTGGDALAVGGRANRIGWVGS
jgi:hypothetical protein